MDEETKNVLGVLDGKLNAIYESVEKTRKYFLVTLIISVVMVVLPIIGLIIVIPTVINTYSTMYEEVL